MLDVIVIGGGVIGLSIAYELAGRGVAVSVLDQGPLGREASWAGAGMLPPGNPQQAREPLSRLRAESHTHWQPLSEQLLAQTGIDNGYRNCGGIEICLMEDRSALNSEMASWRSEGVRLEELSPDKVFALEPAVSPEVTAAYRLPEMSQVRNPRHLKALLVGCAMRGVDLRPATPVYDFDREGEKIVAVQTQDGVLQAGQFVVAAGAWSQRLIERVGHLVSIQPMRGQIVLLERRPLPFRHILQIGARYLVPRPDGRILVGSTEESAGFDKSNTARGIAGLLEFAASIVPSLAGARFERAWAGLRPRTADGFPFLGSLPGTNNLYVAAGHFREGLQLSPATGLVIAQLLLGESPAVPLEAFACDRNIKELKSNPVPR